jgi:hypothetical protein
MDIRTLITTMMVIQTLGSFAQTKLDSIIFGKINEYRIYNYVLPQHLSKKVSKIAEHHADYCSRIQYLNTGQNVDVDSFEEEENEMNRYARYFDTVMISPQGLVLSFIWDKKDSMTIEQVGERAFKNLIDNEDTRAAILDDYPQFIGIGHVIGNRFEETIVNVITEEIYTTSITGKIYYLSIYYCDGLCL